MPRIFCDQPLLAGAEIALDERAARHVQVLRLQPGTALTVFNGHGGEWSAQVTRMGRSDVQVQLIEHSPIEREASCAVHLCVGMPTNERMDWLVEKATELGAASIQPLMTQRAVLRLEGERADKKRAHWQAIAVAACEQSGRNRVPVVHPVLPFAAWCASAQTANGADVQAFVLSLRAHSKALQTTALKNTVQLLSGPEGGLTSAEEDTAIAQGFAPCTLGVRVLRAETAPLAALSLISLR
jgi:16S rRNA (uracil1498-N3)-methyltransferase